MFEVIEYWTLNYVCPIIKEPFTEVGSSCMHRKLFCTTLCLQIPLFTFYLLPFAFYLAALPFPVLFRPFDDKLLPGRIAIGVGYGKDILIAPAGHVNDNRFVTIQVGRLLECLDKTMR